MTIIEDTRQQANKHEIKNKYFEEHGIKILRSKLPFGDYALVNDLSLVIDTKKDIQEIIGNVIHDNKRFLNEIKNAHYYDIQIIFLIENEDGVQCIDDLYSWYNKRLVSSPRATKGSTLAKILTTIEKKYNTKFLFCNPNDTGFIINNILTTKQY